MIEARVRSRWKSRLAGARGLDEVRRDPIPHPRHHPREDLFGQHALHELIGVGKQVALDAVAPQVERAEEQPVSGHPQDVVGPGQSLRFEQARQLGHRRAFAKGHVVLEHLASLDQREDGQGIRSPGHLVFASLQVAHAAFRNGQQDEAKGAPDHSGLLEEKGDLPDSPMGGNLDHARSIQKAGGGGQNPPRLDPEEQHAEGKDQGQDRLDPRASLLTAVSPFPGDQRAFSDHFAYVARAFVTRQPCDAGAMLPAGFLV